MIFGKMFNAGVAFFIGSQTNAEMNLPNVGSVTGSELGGIALIDVIILIVALYFYRFKNNFIAACAILIVAFLSLLNIVDGYYISAYTEPKTMKVIMAGLYFLTSVLAVVATYRYKKLKK